MRVFLGLIVAAALGVGAWLFLRGEPEQGLDLGGAELPPIAEREGPELLGLDAGLRPGSKVPTGRGQLVVRVRRGGAPAQAEVQLTFLRRLTSGQPYAQRGPDYYRRVVFGRPPAAPPIVAKRSTDEAGQLEITGLAAGMYRVEARGVDGARGAALAALTLEGVRIAVELSLSAPGAAFEGRVEWSDGQPFEGELVVSPQPGRQDWWAMSFQPCTDGTYTAVRDGAFRLEGLSEGRFHVHVRVGDELTASGGAVTLPQAEAFKLVLVRPTHEFLGRVLVEGEETPIPGAELYAFVNSSGSVIPGQPTMPAVRTSSDGEGRFRVLLSPGAAMVLCGAPGFPSRSTSVAADAKDVTIRLRRGGGLRGQVLSSVDATPVQGTVVYATGRDGGAANVTTDREGRYAIEDLPVGEATVYVRGGGWISPELGRLPEWGYNPLAVEIVSGTQVSMDLRAERAGALQGRVLDAAGQPVPGAVVGVRQESLPSVRGLLGPSVTTSPDGAFRIENLGVGSNLIVDVRSLEHAPKRSGPHAITAEPGAPIEIRLEAPRWVDAQVLTQDGDRPVIGAMVYLTRVEVSGGSQSHMQDAMGTTGPDGRVRLGPVGSGPLKASAQGPELDMPNRSEQVDVEGSAEGALELKATLRLRPSSQVEGRVELPNGTPASSASVTEQGGRSRRVTAGQDGRFRMPADGRQEMALRAEHVTADGARLTALTNATAGTKDVVLRLAPDERPSQALIVRVTDANGAPVARASVTLEAGGSSWGQGILEGQTRFDISPETNAGVLQAIEGGKAFVVVSRAQDESGAPLPLGPVRVGPLTKDQRLLEVRLPAERVIQGRVMGPDGAPLRGVLVRATAVEPAAKDGSRNRQSQTSQGRSDAEGRFRVGGLGEGLHALTALGPPNLIAPTIDPAPSGANDVLIRFREGVTARVRVTDADGNPFPFATVSTEVIQPSSRGDDGTPWRGPGSSRRGLPQTGADGVALLEGLDAELTYVLRVQPPEPSPLLPYEQRDWHPGDVAVQLERGYAVAGIVRDPGGRPVAQATVFQKRADGGWQGNQTDAQGRFRIANLRAGPVVLRAAPPGDNMMEWQREGAPEVTVSAGTENVTFTLEPGLELVVELVYPPGVSRPHAYVQLLLPQEGQSPTVGQSFSQEGKPARFLGLKKDVRYSIWAGPQGDDLYGWVTDVRAGGTLKLQFERGQSIRGKLSAPTGASNLNISAHDTLGRSAGGAVAADGTFEIKGLPPGRWTVGAHGQKDETWWHASGTADTGGTLDLMLAVSR